MRLPPRFNPGPGIADFWHEFRRPNPYRWPILGASVLFTLALLALLSDRVANLGWVFGVLLVLAIGGAGLMLAYERFKLNVPMLAVAAAITFTMLYQFTREHARVLPQPPEVTYITTFAPGRSDAQIEASNLAAQKRQDAANRLQAQREEETRAMYRKLGRATGIDVDQMAREMQGDQPTPEPTVARARK
jgi:hypothetical protein